MAWIPGGTLVKIDGRVFSVFKAVSGSERVMLEDVNGSVRRTTIAADEVKSLDHPSPEEMSLFWASNELVYNRHQKASRAFAILDAWAAVLPARIVNEEFGDYLEDIHRRVAAGQRSWIFVRVMTAIFWTGVNAWGYLLNQLRRRKTT